VAGSGDVVRLRVKLGVVAHLKSIFKIEKESEKRSEDGRFLRGYPARMPPNAAASVLLIHVGSLPL